jgi:hypothetical protein
LDSCRLAALTLWRHWIAPSSLLVEDALKKRKRASGGTCIRALVGFWRHSFSALAELAYRLSVRSGRNTWAAQRLCALRILNAMSGL